MNGITNAIMCIRNVRELIDFFGEDFFSIETVRKMCCFHLHMFYKLALGFDDLVVLSIGIEIIEIFCDLNFICFDYDDIKTGILELASDNTLMILESVLYSKY